MIYGAITNSWREQLPSSSVKELVGAAVEKGAKHIELRQTCLGECEEGAGPDWRPNLKELKKVVDTYPQLTFDLAMALPCLSQKIDPQGEMFQSALAGAKLVGGSQPHLRVVDPAPFNAVWNSPSDIPEEALGLAELATEAANQGVIMSMENSKLPISIDDGGGESLSINRSPQDDRHTLGIQGLTWEIGSCGDFNGVAIPRCVNCRRDGWIRFRWHSKDVGGRIATLVGNSVFIAVGAG